MMKELKPGWVILAMVAAFGIAGHIEFDEMQQAHATKNEQMRIKLTEQEARLASKLAAKGAVDPAGLAKAVSGKKHEKVLAAVAIKESRGDLRAVGRVGERGAFQVRAELHGPVHPHDLKAQADQAEVILEQMIREQGSLSKGIKAYNGTGRDASRYARRVLDLAKELGA